MKFVNSREVLTLCQTETDPKKNNVKHKRTPGFNKNKDTGLTQASHRP